MMAKSCLYASSYVENLSLKLSMVTSSIWEAIPSSFDGSFDEEIVIIYGFGQHQMRGFIKARAKISTMKEITETFSALAHRTQTSSKHRGTDLAKWFQRGSWENEKSFHSLSLRFIRMKISFSSKPYHRTFKFIHPVPRIRTSILGSVPCP